WIGMIEAGLRAQAENNKKIILEGTIIEDPPEVAAIFSRARERYLRASEQNPAVYRKMQDAFGISFALLMQAASYGLEFYLEHLEYSPDIIGQVFRLYLQPGILWTPYFPAWDISLAEAGRCVPDGAGRIHADLALASLRARQDGVQVPPLLPGRNWEVWYAVVQPYVIPRVVSSSINSSVMMLAVAAQFPDWAVKGDLVRFAWQGEGPAEPVIKSMANINAMLYSLNGYYMEQVRALVEIVEAQESGRIAPQPLEAVAPEIVY
ncbi:MAG: hypothetical protein GY792_27850, partial [Gammaproteobacteria bacterium]|nr:hypothetical protein [Gammaproteobacteria bacterium]